MTALTAPEQRKLNDLEGIIEAGLQTFVEVGAALSIIREQRLYRQSHGTFEDYVEARWGWSRRRAYQLMEASDVVANVNHGSQTPITNERQARELAAVPEEQRPEVWETATKAAEAEGKKPTAKHVREAGVPFRPKMPAPPRPKSKVEQLAAARVQQVEEREAVPEAKRTKPRPNITHVMALVDAATSMPEVTDEQLDAIPFNDFMGERLRVARDVIDRILQHHRRQSA